MQSYTSGVDFGYGSAASVAAAASGTNTLLSADDDDVTDTTAAAAATGPAARPRPHQQHQPERNSNRTNTQQCMNCGRNHGPRRNACPARNATCNFCTKLGHFERVCLKKYPHLLEQRKVSSVLVVGANINAPPQPAVTVNMSHSNLPRLSK